MQAARRQQLSAIMSLAWDKYRYEQRGRAPISFAAALRHAWAWHKGAAERAAADARYEAAPAKRTIAYRSMVASPIRRAMTGPYKNARAGSAGYITSSLGR